MPTCFWARLIYATNTRGPFKAIPLKTFPCTANSTHHIYTHVYITRVIAAITDALIEQSKKVIANPRD